MLQKVLEPVKASRFTRIRDRVFGNYKITDRERLDWFPYTIYIRGNWFGWRWLGSASSINECEAIAKSFYGADARPSWFSYRSR